ncbi:MAG: accessory gene regulator B family protein, partial [Erysipelotrichaceae bacterium]|nr:accessory gene regulator B family protein [Erysipelotrichaceae bacterium]
MITSMAHYIAVFLLKNDVINKENLNIYIYGFELMISSGINIVTTIVLGVLFSKLTECLVFLISFILLRKYCGGYHANSYLKCNTIFTTNIIIVVLILKIGVTSTIRTHYI